MTFQIRARRWTVVMAGILSSALVVASQPSKSNASSAVAPLDQSQGGALHFFRVDASAPAGYVD
ncbi:hypothetical protein GCM10012289_42410 [Nonomuraea cavernae]|uniref:Uncharacterized protein n=1 Tax=Nonomuraea cavernae TaxID=2045107 RepID=A0A917Z257_9ACTN|nr:hypothetical protein [Nonomuraea cavernae]GGO73010.1 hypothetical protein GCM10012289_42410 [Nonomuraea cavernae]